MKIINPDLQSAVLELGPVRLINVPHAAALAREVFDEDCYRINDIPTGSLVLDIGACYGEFSFLAKNARDCTVIAYEPAPQNREIFEINKALNGARFCKTFKLHPMAISATPGKRPFYFRPDHPAGSALVDYNKGVASNVVCDTLTSQLISTLKEQSPAKTTPVVIKMDCEGAEVDIFEQDTEWMSMVNIVTMEWHNHDGDKFAAVLEGKGFKVELEGGGPKPRPKWDKSIGAGLLFAKR